MVARDCLTQKTLLVDMKKRDLLLYLVTDTLSPTILNIFANLAMLLFGATNF